MQVDFRNGSGPHYWIVIFWCAFGAVLLGTIAVISYWIRRCRSSKGEARVSDLAILSIENEVASNIDFDEDIAGRPPLQPLRSEEIIISCQRNQQPTPQSLPLKQQNQKVITRSQSSKVIQELQNQHTVHQLKQQQSLPQPLHAPPTSGNGSHHPHTSKSVSILVYKTLNTVFKSSRKIIVRVCEVASVKKSFTMFKFNKAAAQHRAEARANNCTGHDQFVRPPVSDKKAKHIMKKLYKQNGLKRSNSAIEFDVSALSAANRRQIYGGNRSASSEQDNSDHSEHSEKSPLVSARLDNLARLFFSKSMPAETGSRDTIESVLTTRPNLKYQYSALDSGNGVIERSPRERAHREHAFNATQEWVHSSNGRYEVIAHLDEIGSRHSKNWFLVNDSSVRTDRLMTLLPLPPDCVALDDLPEDESPRGILMELLGSLHHPYIYPVLDLGLLRTSSHNYACLVTPFNSRGSLKDLIYKTQWNEPWARKYTRKPNGLPASQVQRLGRQILEALLFLKERGFPLHGHLHSGNVILQNGAARLSGLENGLLGLSSRVNAVMWSRSTTEIENVDIICFGHLLYEMCTGLEMTTPKPSMRMLEMELDSYPQILDILGMIFDPPAGVCPSVEELVLCDLFRSIDLRELRGPCFSTIKPSLSRSTLNLLQAVKKRQVASLGSSLSETSSPCTPPSTPRDRRSGTSRTMDSFDISSDCEDGLLDEIVVGYHQHYPKLIRMEQYQRQQQQHYQQQHFPYSSGYQHLQPCQQNPQQQKHYDPLDSPIHYCDNTTHSDDIGLSTLEYSQYNNQSQLHHSSLNTNSSIINISVAADTTPSYGSNTSADLTSITATINSSCGMDDNKPTIMGDQLELDAISNKDIHTTACNEPLSIATSSTMFHQYTGNTSAISNSSSHSSSTSAAALFNNQLTADMCGLKNSKSRRLEYSLKCLKYGRSNPSQDSAFGSLTDGDLSTGSSSFRLSSFQSISSPIDEGVEDIIIATTTAGKETSLELATIPKNMVSQDSAISSPCRETSPSNFLTIEDAPSGCCSAGSSSSSSSGHVRPQHFPISLSPKILVTATNNSSNSSLASSANVQQLQQFDPPKILVNDQNSIYTTSPSKRSGTIEVFSQKYRVSSFEDMSPNKRSTAAGGSSSSSGKHLKNANRMAFRSLEEERRIESAFMPIKNRTNSENRVNMQSEKYKKLTHASFRISKTSSQINILETSQSPDVTSSSPGSSAEVASTSDDIDIPSTNKQLRPNTASGSSSSRQALWRDSKFYRKNRIAKSNDSLLETSPHHSARLSPSSLRDNHYDCFSSYGSAHSGSRQSLNRGCSVNEITGSNQNLGMGLSATTNLCGISTGNRRYCSSKSEDLGEPNDYLQVINARKSCSERHLVSLTKLKQTAITTTMDNNEQSCLSEDDLSFNEDNNAHRHQYSHEPQQNQAPFHQKQHQHMFNRQQYHHQYAQPQFVRAHPNHLSLSTCSINRITTTKIRTTSLATLSCHQNLTAVSGSTTENPGSSTSKAVPSTSLSSSVFKSFDYAVNFEDSVGDNHTADATNEDSSSTDESSSHQILSSAELSKIFASDDAQGSSCSEEKTPLLDSVEMSPISPTEPTKLAYSEQM